MATSLPQFASTTVIVPNSGLQFLDFAFDATALKLRSIPFWEEPTGTADATGKPQVALRKLSKDADGNLVFWDTEREAQRSAPETEAYSISAAKALEAFDRQWLPLPVLRLAERSDEGAESYRQGPTGWARVQVVALPGAREGEPTHRVVVALDTSLQAEPGDESAGRPYISPSEEDAASGAIFRLVTDHAQNAWFLNLPWVAQWLWESFRDHRQQQRPGRSITAEDLPYACEHWARYATLLDILGEALRFPDLRLVDMLTPGHVKPIDVDLVLDIGNSRTCGILFESIGESFSMRNAYVLELRDLMRPTESYGEPFESRLEFAKPSFGREHIRIGRPDLFVWPSLVRVGAEAARLASEARGTEGATGLSSPKRYLWDNRRARQPWRFNTAEAPAWDKAGEITGPVTALVTETGDVISQIKTRPGDLPPVSAVLPLFSRSSLYSFMVGEILLQALMMINAPGTRSRRQHADVPRRLRRLVFTLPPATPLAEQRIMRQRIEGAITLVWELLGWTLSENPLHQRPQVEVNWDEASCTQMVYLFSEVTQKLRTTAGDFFRIVGRNRDSDGKPTLRVASVDVGGGTTDLMITTYRVEGERSIVPKQEFREGFRIAGDDVLEAVLEQQVLPAIEQHLVACGAQDAREFLRRLFAADRAGLDERMRLRRAVFVTQVLAPIGLGLLHDYERSGESDEEPSVLRDFASFFPPGRLPMEEALAYLEEPAADACLQPFRLAEVRFAMVPQEISNTVISVLESVLLDLCEVIHAYDCDVVLLSGRPSRLPAVQQFVRAKLPVTPDRVIAMHSYRAGEWYPFGDSQLRVSDPKTTAAVGAMLYAIAESQIEAFSLRSSQLRLRSTARYIGEMEISGQIRHELFSNIDLDAKAAQPLTCELEVYTPIFIGFRQLPIARWTATPLYYLEFRNPEEVSRLPRPLKVTLERQESEREEEREVSLEDFRVREVVDAEGEARRRDLVVLRLQTLKAEAGYWLDTGVLSLN